MVRNIKLIISYDGSRYHGWQKQKNKETVQDTIEKATASVFKQKIELVGSGRTDSGVHAIGQVANFLSDTSIPQEKIKIALNAKLPDDIRIIDSKDVAMEFNARFDAHDKTYMYQIFNDNVYSPFYSNYSMFVPVQLDVEKMNSSIKLLVGTHDFKGFMAAGSEVKTTIRTIYEAKVIKEEKVIKVLLTGNGFLYNMVRIIAGTLIDIGKGKKFEESFLEALKYKDRKFLGQTAQAQGLFLLEVNYEKHLDN